MILGSLKDTSRYELLHPLFRQAFDYLRANDFANAETGRYELCGNDLFAIVSDSDMHPESDTPLEVHNQYIDIQLPVSKAETFGWKARSELKDEKRKFDTEKDIQFFGDAKTTLFSVSSGNFVIFFPQDGHAPCIGEGTIRKVVVKIKIES